MQVTNQQLPAQLRRSSRVRKVAVVLLAAYAVKKLSPYLWRRLQVTHTHRLAHTQKNFNETGVFRGLRLEKRWVEPASP